MKRMKQMTKQQKKKVCRTILEFAAATAAGVLLYAMFRPYAVEARGCALYGGEVMLLGMPADWAAIRSVINDFRER